MVISIVMSELYLRILLRDDNTIHSILLGRIEVTPCSIIMDTASDVSVGWHD